MRYVLSVFLALAIGGFGGLALTWIALASGVQFGAVTVGPWNAWPKSGTEYADPYARALFAQTAYLPLGSGDGVAFVARHDSKGRKLNGECVISIEGLTPQARFWTFTVHDYDGRVIDNPLQRYGFTSQEVVREEGGRVRLVVAPRARAGFWVPTSNVSDILFILRLYDTPLGITTRSGKDTPMPVISQGECS